MESPLAVCGLAQPSLAVGEKSLLCVGTGARSEDQVVLNMLSASSPSLTESQGDINEQ